ncbi:hypothetical protein NKH18_48650 [Streptomyces sp. M10(2022)]
MCTGMRLTEASCLLEPEVPPPAHGRGLPSVKVDDEREKARTVYARRRVVRDLHHYLAIERDEVVQRTREAGATPGRAGTGCCVQAGRRCWLRAVRGHGPMRASGTRIGCGWCRWMRMAVSWGHCGCGWAKAGSR